MVKETEEEMKEIDKLYKTGMKFIVRKNGNFYAVLTERAKEQSEKFLKEYSKYKKQME